MGICDPECATYMLFYQYYYLQTCSSFALDLNHRHSVKGNGRLVYDEGEPVLLAGYGRRGHDPHAVWYRLFLHGVFADLADEKHVVEEKDVHVRGLCSICQKKDRQQNLHLHFFWLNNFVNTKTPIPLISINVYSKSDICFHPGHNLINLLKTQKAKQMFFTANKTVSKKPRYHVMDIHEFTFYNYFTEYLSLAENF